jgi:hypothetical protein
MLLLMVLGCFDLLVNFIDNVAPQENGRSMAHQGIKSNYWHLVIYKVCNFKN